MNNKELSDLLQNSVFRDADRVRIDRLIAEGQEVDVPANTVFLREGDIADAFYVIKAGSVQIFSKGRQDQEIVIAREEAGDFFGEQALLSPTPGLRNASVRTLTDCKLLRISHDSFLDLVESDDGLKRELKKIGIRELLARFRASEPEYDVSQLFLEAADLFETKVFKPGETIISSGAPPGPVYFLLSGNVDIYKKNDQGVETFVCTNTPNNLFGESSHVRGTTTTATVKAHDLARVLVVPGDKFEELYCSNPKLKRIVDTLQQTFNYPKRGRIKQYVGTFLSQPTVINHFTLGNGREVISNCVVGRNIQSIRELDTTPSETITFEDKHVVRELELSNGRAIGLVSYGPWGQMSDLYARVLDAGSVTDVEIKSFRDTGDISSHNKSLPEDKRDENICKCMNVSRGEISGLIKIGCLTLKEISAKCGAGTACGGCVPEIMGMLGHMSWQPMLLHDGAQLTPDTRAYRLSSLKKIPLAPFQAGQHVVLQCEIEEKWIERSYTLTSSPGNSAFYEIAVKREEKGLVSRWLFENDELVPFVRVSRPKGKIVLDLEKTNPLVCITGGIGVTPAVAFARTLTELNSPRPLVIFVSATTKEQLVYNSELEALAISNKLIQYLPHLTKERGRITTDDAIKIAREFKDADFFVCGRKEFADLIRSALVTAGVKEKRILIEQFVHASGISLG